MSERAGVWRCRDRVLDCGRPALVMGIVNVTPDSFSDGGRFASTDLAVAHGLELVLQGADLLDVGGESSRPGAQPVPLEEELNRVVPVVRELAQRATVPISVDTTKAEVARQTLDAGAHIINDITALLGDPQMPDVVRSYQTGVVLMHMQGTPATMQLNPTYEDVVREVRDFLEARLQAVRNLGIAEDRVVLDPGIGFGKTAEHNWELLRRLHELQGLGRPVCLGVSRKGLLRGPRNRPTERRMAASLAVACFALARGAAQIVRVHDVAETRDAVEVFRALRNDASSEPEA
jgi:dihydropteroate synthase